MKFLRQRKETEMPYIIVNGGNDGLSNTGDEVLSASLSGTVLDWTRNKEDAKEYSSRAKAQNVVDLLEDYYGTVAVVEEVR